MKWKSILDFVFRVILFGLLVFVIVWIINLLKDHKENAIPEGAVAMDFPLKDGSYSINYSGPGQDIFSGPVHQSPNEKYALDITKGTSIKDLVSTFITHNFKNNSTFGTPIYSPCVGNVKKTSNDKLDMPVGTKDPISGGNFVIVGCNQFDVGFAHMKQGSVVVHEGQIVHNGDLLGEIGNSGNSSGPHLHMVATRTEGRDTIVPLPMVFGGRYLIKGDMIEN